RSAISIPFPYTTLFRSSAGSANSRQPGPGSSQPELHASLVENCLLRVGRESRVGRLPAQQLQRKGQLQVVLRVRRHIGSGAGTLDRKSTRLNSSHVKIS